MEHPRNKPKTVRSESEKKTRIKYAGAFANIDPYV